ncbi:MAG: hypothetical protein IKF17_00105 [Clostridia bacterium]|nr:hypothetical protein [Clostridia bacterium]
MNQILTTKPVRPSKTVKVKTVKSFFAICLMIFGLCMASSASYALYKNNAINSANKTNNINNNPVQTTATDNIQIHLSNEDAIIHATVIGQNEISFVTYKWDDEEETRVDVNSISDDIEIEIPAGEHTLTITAVDINNNSQTKNQQVKGITKPTLEVMQDGSEFVIKATDEIGLDKFEFILNGQGYLVRVEGEKEKEFRYPLEEGDNTLEVKAYNVEGVTETFNAICHN